MTKEYVQMVGRMAYLWGWPLVNSHNRRVAFGKAPEQGLLGGVVPVAPSGKPMLTDYISRTRRSSPVRTRTSFMAADTSRWTAEPVVFQVPDFGDRFWVYALYDARTDEFSEIGKQYGTKPGFYLMVGPNWKGATPAGITAVVRSSTVAASSLLRAFSWTTTRKITKPSSRARSGHVLPASAVRQEDEDEGLEQAPAFPGAEIRTERARRSGSTRRRSLTSCRR